MIENVIVRNSNREILAVLEQFNSVTWKTEYDDCGAFEINAPYTDDNMAILQPFNYLTRPDRTELGIIENVGFSYDAKGGRTIKARGRFALSLLEKRLCAHPSALRMPGTFYTTYAGVASGCNRLLNENIINSDWTSRNISFLKLGTQTGVSGTVNATLCREQTLLEATQGFLRNNSAGKWYGQRMRFDEDSLNIFYDLYDGRDLSNELVFSAELENLLTFDYTKNTALFKNRFAVAGDGEGKDQYVANVNRGSASGVELAEFWYKANCSKSFKTSDGSDYTFTDAEYEAALTSAVQEVFNEHSTAVEVKGTVDLSKLEYGTDFKEGDIVTIQDSGISATARITSVIENQDGGGYSIQAEFGG